MAWRAEALCDELTALRCVPWRAAPEGAWPPAGSSPASEELGPGVLPPAAAPQAFAVALPVCHGK